MGDKKIDYVKKVFMLFLVLILSITWGFLLLRLDKITTQVFSMLKSIRAIFYGIIIAYLFNPIMMSSREYIFQFFTRHNFKINKQKWAKALSIVITCVIGITILFAICFVILPNIYSTTVDLLPKLPSQIEKYATAITDKLDDNKQLYSTVNMFVQKLSSYLENWISDNLISKSSNILSYITKSMISVTRLTLDMVIGIIVAIYAFMEKEKFVGQFKKLLYAIFSIKRANSIIDTVRYAHKIFSGFLVGKLIDSLIVGIICYPILYIMGMPYVLLLSVIIGVTNIIPYFGPFIGAVPCTLLVFLVDPKQSLYFLIFIIILQQIDGNILGPKILKNTTNVSEFWVTFALLLAGSLWGIMGMIIGVPLFAVIYYIIKIVIENKLVSKHLPRESSKYTNAKNINEESKILVYNDNALK